MSDEQDTPSELLKLDICAIHEWTPIQLVAMRSRIDSELAAREAILARDLAAVKRARAHSEPRRTPTGRVERRDKGLRKGPRGTAQVETAKVGGMAS